MEEQHPMIPVPHALRAVLEQTAISIVQRFNSVNKESKRSSKSNYVSLDSPSEVIGRISAETICAPQIGYPPYHASIMDGYAININQCQLNSDSTIQQFQIVNRVHAGKSSTEESQSRLKSAMNIIQNDNLPKAIYVTTGAMIPYPEYNAVIPIENVDEYLSNQVIAIELNVLNQTTLNQWIRNTGCDIASNTIILEKGNMIEPVHIGLLLQCGITEIKVNPFPIVGILSTGNEILSINEIKNQNYMKDGHTDKKNLGMIPDANGPVLTSLLSSYRSCRTVNYGIVNDDDIVSLTETISRATEECDVLITSGGVSMGEKDVIKHVLIEKLGCQVHFGRLHMKPGKPTTFATTNIDDKKQCLIFALPGNPVSTYVCAELLVRPCLDMLHFAFVPGANVAQSVDHGKVLSMVQNANVHAEIHAKLKNRVKLDVERPEYLRVKLTTRVEHDVDGKTSIEFYAVSTGIQRSSRLMSMCDADGLMIMPQGIRSEKDYAEAGESFPVILLRRPGGLTIEDSFLNTIKFKDSSHYRRSSLVMGILEIAAPQNEIDQKISDQNDTNIKKRIENIIGGDPMIIVQNMIISQNDDVAQAILKDMSNCLDIILVICTNIIFPLQLEISDQIKKCISKHADAISFQARRSAAYSNPLLGLFEPVAGYCEMDGKSCMILSLPNDGMESSLSSVKALLKKGSYMATGKNEIK